MNKGIELANQVIADPTLLKVLNDDTFIKFVIALSIKNKDLAIRVMDLREDVPAQNKILFWEAVGIIQNESYE